MRREAQVFLVFKLRDFLVCGCARQCWKMTSILPRDTTSVNLTFVAWCGGVVVKPD